MGKPRKVAEPLSRAALERIGQMRLPLSGPLPLPTEGTEQREAHAQKGEKSGKD